MGKLRATFVSLKIGASSKTNNPADSVLLLRNLCSRKNSRDKNFLQARGIFSLRRCSCGSTAIGSNHFDLRENLICSDVHPVSSSLHLIAETRSTPHSPLFSALQRDLLGTATSCGGYRPHRIDHPCERLYSRTCDSDKATSSKWQYRRAF